jgi:hypothetical protein
VAPREGITNKTGIVPRQKNEIPITAACKEIIRKFHRTYSGWWLTN